MIECDSRWGGVLSVVLGSKSSSVSVSVILTGVMLTGLYGCKFVPKIAKLAKMLNDRIRSLVEISLPL